jgi:hypothetical protein
MEKKLKGKVFKETRVHSPFLEWWFPALLSVKITFSYLSLGLFLYAYHAGRDLPL